MSDTKNGAPESFVPIRALPALLLTRVWAQAGVLAVWLIAAMVGLVLAPPFVFTDRKLVVALAALATAVVSARRVLAVFRALSHRRRLAVALAVWVVVAGLWLGQFFVWINDGVAAVIFALFVGWGALCLRWVWKSPNLPEVSVRHGPSGLALVLVAAVCVLVVATGLPRISHVWTNAAYIDRVSAERGTGEPIPIGPIDRYGDGTYILRDPDLPSGSVRSVARRPCVPVYGPYYWCGVLTD